VPNPREPEPEDAIAPPPVNGGISKWWWVLAAVIAAVLSFVAFIPIPV